MSDALLRLRAAGIPFRGLRISNGGGGGGSSYSLTGPNTATAGTPATYTVTLLSGSGGTVTPNDNYHAGTFSPTSVTLSTGAPVATFTHSAVAAGPRTIATTNNAGMTDPSPISVTVSRPAGAQAITAQWLTDNAAALGGPPYILGQSFTNGPNSYPAAAYYYLQADINVPGSAFLSLGNSVLLDQCGHNVTFGNLAFFGFPLNGEFESGSGTSVPNWNLSGAPTAVIVPASQNYLFGNQALRFNAPAANAAQVIVSDTFSVPSAAVGIPLVAIVAPSSGGDQSVFGTLLTEVVDSGSGTTVATFSNTRAYQGFFSDSGDLNLAAEWSPASTGPFFVRITWTPSVSGKIMDIDHVSITAAYHYAFLCNINATHWYNAVPAAIQALYTAAHSHFYSFAVVNSVPGTGVIAKGSNLGYGGGIAEVTYLRDYAVFLDLTCTMNGDNSTGAIMAGGVGNGSAGSLTVSGCSVTYANAINGDHYLARGVIVLANGAAGPSIVANCTFAGFPQHGVMFSDAPPSSGIHLVTGCSFGGNATVADAYAIQMGATTNVHAVNFDINTTNGYGIGIDQYGTALQPATGIVIGPGTINYAVLPNRESGNQGVGYGVKHRNTSGSPTTFGALSVLIDSVDITCNVNAGGMTNGQCIFFSHMDTNGSNLGIGSLIQNSNLKCIVNTSDPTYVGSCLNIYGITPGVNPGFTNNTLETNDTSLWIGGVNANPISGLTVMSNTYKKSSEGDQTRPYIAIKAGIASGQTVASTYVFDPIFVGGASLNVSFWGAQSMAIGVGYTDTVHVQSSGGVAQSGASVTLTNAAGSGGGAATAFAGIVPATRTYPSSSNTGTTDGSGNLSSVSIVTDTYTSQGIVGPYAPTHTALAPIHFAATSGGLSGSADATPTTGGTTTVSVA